MQTRPDKHGTFINIARILSMRTTCSRRGVGCVLVNHQGHILSTGYNGVGRGLTHCTEKPCRGSKLPTGVGLGECEAIHAEQNALLQCPNVEDIYAAYITCSPCMHCAKLFLNTGVKHIYYIDVYNKDAIKLLESAAVKCKRFKINASRTV